MVKDEEEVRIARLSCPVSSCDYITEELEIENGKWLFFTRRVHVYYLKC